MNADTGVSLKTASLVTSMFQIGGTVGAITLGWLIDKFNPNYVLAISYSLTGLFIAALVGLAVFGAGFCVSGYGCGIMTLRPIC